MRRLLLLLPLLLALAGCGAKENRALLTQADADALLARVDEAQEAVSDDDCDEARRALRDASDQVEALDEEVSTRLRDNLQEWIAQARGGIGDACEDEPEETPTPEETETPEPTPTPTEEPTEEPTQEPTATPTAEPTENPGNGTGGSGAEEGAGG